MKKYLFFTALFALIIPVNFIFAKTDDAKLNQEIKDKTSLVNSLTEKIRVYEENIRKKNEEKIDLKNEVNVLEDTISKTETEISKTETEISKLNSEIKLTKSKIEAAETEIGDKQAQISSFILDIYQSEQKTNLEVLLNNSNLSEYFTDLEYSENLQDKLQKNVDLLEQLKMDLQNQKNDLDTKKKDESEKKDKLKIQQDSLEGEKIFKNDLLDQVSGDEAKFQELLKKVESEQNAVENEIASLEKQMRTKIEQPQETPDEANFNLTNFKPDWPTTSHYITCGWHCPNYFVGFVHSAIDIRVSQGTAVYAADNGYVWTARSTGTTAYNYVMIGHAEGFSTVYGHLSAIYVEPGQKVLKGQLIGLSGGMPGTIGAGWMTTGPHLHFEVRLNGIAVNPSSYLP